MTTSTNQRSVNKLNNAQIFKLYGYVTTHYAAAKLDDPAFAAKATIDLGFNINERNVAGAREQLGIESTKATELAAKPTVEALLARVVKLEDEVASLKEWRLNMNLGGVVGVAYGRGERPASSTPARNGAAAASTGAN